MINITAILFITQHILAIAKLQEVWERREVELSNGVLDGHGVMGCSFTELQGPKAVTPFSPLGLCLPCSRLIYIKNFLHFGFLFLMLYVVHLLLFILSSFGC